MVTTNSYKQYQRTTIETASQKQLIIMLYDGAIRFLRVAKEGIEEKDLELAHNALIRSQAIVLELLSGLNPETGEIAEGLAALYQYFLQRLVEANKDKDQKIIDEVLSFLVDLRDVWDQINDEKKTPPQPKKTLHKEEQRIHQKISLQA